MKISSAIVFKKIDATEDPFVLGLCHAAEKVMERNNIPIITEDSANEETLVVVIGGDGTMLSAARMAVNTGSLLLGINIGHLGFLTEFSPDEMVECIESVLRHDKVKVEERTLLEMDILGKKLIAFNDFVISNVYSDHFITYQLHIGENGQSKDNAGKHKANSLIISSPTGSTAYSLHVGGAILAPNLNVVQLLPIASMTITTRPIIVSGDSYIEIKLKPSNTTNLISIKVDGWEEMQAEEHKLGKMLVRTFSNKVKMIHARDWNFYDTLTEKLQWNK